MNCKNEWGKELWKLKTSSPTEYDGENRWLVRLKNAG